MAIVPLAVLAARVTDASYTPSHGLFQSPHIVSAADLAAVVIEANAPIFRSYGNADASVTVSGQELKVLSPDKLGTPGELGMKIAHDGDEKEAEEEGEEGEEEEEEEEGEGWDLRGMLQSSHDSPSP